ncbi:hypothetical protein Agub_g11324, partial [Astrephomene gubernaculifera]
GIYKCIVQELMARVNTCTAVVTRKAAPRFRFHKAGLPKAKLTPSDTVERSPPNALLTDLGNQELTACNVNFLRRTFKAHLVEELLRVQPEVLTAGLTEWHLFLTGYGLTDEDIWKILRYSPQLLRRGPGGDASGLGTSNATSGKEGYNSNPTQETPASTAVANTPYNAGAAIMFLKSYGWTDEDITQRVLACYPEVLTATPEELQASVDFLRSRSFDEAAIRRLVLTCPLLLVAPVTDPDLFPLIDRIRASAHNKYVISGSYHV